MGPWSYYSPLWIGFVVVLAVNDAIRRALPPTWTPGLHWTVVLACGVGFAVQCQLLMLGAQGVFAQVLPAPRGRSIRGRTAVLAGWLLIAWFALAGIAGFLLLQRVGGLALAAGLAALVALVGAAIAYVWGLPAAVTDFGDERRRR